MTIYIVHLFLLILSFSEANGKFRYDYMYSKAAEGWLKLHRVPATFREAFLRCNFEGAVLASPLNEDLHTALMQIHPKSPFNCGMYTGIHATISHGDYTSIEGIPLARIPANWSLDEPDNYRDQEDCLIMTRDGALADVRCNETFPYTCYKKKTKNLIISECGTSDPSYKLDRTTGSCYKFHAQGLSWRRAQMVCLAEGGHLAIINSQAEMNVIQALFAQNPSNTIRSVYKDSASLGFKDWGEGLWFTVHGQSLHEAGYSVWSAGQPDNAALKNQGQHCGAVFRNGLLDDIWCEDVNLAFICEKTPESLNTDDEAGQRK